MPRFDSLAPVCYDIINSSGKHHVKLQPKIIILSACYTISGCVDAGQFHFGSHCRPQ